MWHHVWLCERVLRKMFRSSPNETKWDKVNPVKSNESKWNQMNPSGTKWDQMSPSETTWNQMSPSETMWNQMSPSGTKWDQMGLRELHCTLPPSLPISLQAGLIGIACLQGRMIWRWLWLGPGWDNFKQLAFKFRTKSVSSIEHPAWHQDAKHRLRPLLTGW